MRRATGSRREPEVPVLDPGALPGARREERSDAAESRRRILNVARELFAERGVDAVSMHEVARAAGVGQGTLYRRYRHKGALCSALLHESIVRFSEEVRVRLADGEPALAQLAWFVDRLAGFNEENGALLGAIRDAAGGHRRLEMHRNPFYGWLRTTVAAMLRWAVEEGEVAAELDVGCIADAILAPLNIDLYLFQRGELGMERERIVQALHGLMLDGVRERSGGGATEVS